MNDQLYELRTYEHVHSGDVRYVASLPDREAFITGSRDKTSKLFIEKYV